MTSGARRKKATEAPAQSVARTTGIYLLFSLPVLLGAVLVLPDFKFPYLSDDYDFLYSAQTFRLAMLLPSSDVVFYRPLSREVYFSLLNALSGANPFLGHLLNTAVFGAAVVLLILVSSRLMGRRGGLIAGLFFAGFGQFPFLVGFVGGIQDLLAITLFLLSLHLQLRANTLTAIAVFGLSLLAKETVVVLVPVLMLLPWIQTGRSRRGFAPALGYLLVVTIWLAIHPGIKLLGAHTARTASTGYIGLYAGTAISKVVSSFRTILNLSPSGIAPPWPNELSVVFVLGVAILATAILLASRAKWPSEVPIGTSWVVTFALYVSVIPALATALLVRQWAPYYLCLPAMGVSVLAALALRRTGWPVVGLVTIVWLALGVWSRGDRSLGPTVSTEATFATASQELNTVERGFRKLRPALPRASRVYVSIQGQGLGAVYNHLYRYQCLRTWYQDPSIRTADPASPLPGRGPEFLYVVRPNLVVDEVTFRHPGPDTLEIEIAPGDPLLDGLGLVRAIRTYAVGLAISGEVERGVQILLQVPTTDVLRRFHWRLAAMFLLAHGETARAHAIMAAAPIPSREESLESLYGYFIRAGEVNLDAAAFRAFEISLRDAGALRSLMRKLEARGHIVAALRCARRLVELVPADREALAAIQRLEAVPQVDRVTRRADE